MDNVVLVVLAGMDTALCRCTLMTIKLMSGSDGVFIWKNTYSCLIIWLIKINHSASKWPGSRLRNAILLTWHCSKKKWRIKWPFKIIKLPMWPEQIGLSGDENEAFIHRLWSQRVEKNTTYYGGDSALLLPMQTSLIQCIVPYTSEISYSTLLCYTMKGLCGNHVNYSNCIYAPKFDPQNPPSLFSYQRPNYFPCKKIGERWNRGQLWLRV